MQRIHYAAQDDLEWRIKSILNAREWHFVHVVAVWMVRTVSAQQRLPPPHTREAVVVAVYGDSAPAALQRSLKRALSLHSHFIMHAVLCRRMGALSTAL